ncbi:MAG TPA: non-canonical purine NTP pyrophosphatase [Abditibacteriaceae bacterium]|jgi:XTP/dITP diphosphohydrolase
MKLLLATGNAHKLGEMRAFLHDIPVEILSLRDVPEVEMPEETGTTMMQNARLKAIACAQQSGLPAIADDSGIEVDALGGEPGVRSARWLEGSDADRTNGILARLEKVPDAERTARYRCAICLAWPPDSSLAYDAETLREETEATCEGRITREWRGANGFGYDPIFELTSETGAPEWVGKTMAEAPPEIKAQISHRARAIEQIRPALRQLFSR